MPVKYPHVKSKLLGQNGNAFNLLSIVKRDLCQGGVSEVEVKAFLQEAIGGDYRHLLLTCLKWVSVI